MSTCALLLSSQAACGLSESTHSRESPLQADLVDPCPPPRLCRPCGENEPVAECLECFAACELCEPFVENKSFMKSNITKYLETSVFFRGKSIEAKMPADLCFDPSKVSEQDYPKEEAASLEVAQSSMISTQISVNFTVHQTINGLNQSGADYPEEHDQFNEELLEQEDKFDSSESSSLSDYSLEHSESFAISSSFDLLEEKSQYFEQSMESEISDAEPFTVPKVKTDLSEQVDAEEVPELVSADCDSLYEHEAFFEDPSEQHRTSEGLEKDVLDLYEQCPESDLDSQPCKDLDHSEPNNQNMPSEYHATHFESSELCQAPKERKPAELSESLEQQPLAGQIETTDKSEFTAEYVLESSTELHDESSDHESEQTVEFYTQQELFNYNHLCEHDGECDKTVEQCSSCGRYFEKCEIPELCNPSEPTDPSENPQQSQPVEKCLELCESSGTECSVFHTSELPREIPAAESNKNKAGKRSECDMMFFGSMETFETRWLSQFLDYHNQQDTSSSVNQEAPDDVVTEPSDEVPISDCNDDYEPVIEVSDDSVKQKVLCRVCERREEGQFHYDEPSELFELCDVKAEAFELDAEGRRSGELVVKRGSLDESSEEEYVDCIDSKSQDSTETDESFKSFVDDPEGFEIYTYQSDDGKHLQNLSEDDEAYEHYTSDSQESCELCDGHDDPCDLYVHDMLEADEEIPQIPQESSFSHKITGQEIIKTYAEALSTGLSVENDQGYQPSADHSETESENEDYSSDLCTEDTTRLHAVEDLSNEPLCEEVIEFCEKTEVLEICDRSGEVYALSSEDEDNCKCLHVEDTSDVHYLQSTHHKQEISSCETLSEKGNIYECEVSDISTEEATQDLIPEIRTDEDKDDSTDTSNTPVSEICEDCEGIDEVDGAHRPCCGEIEICEDDEASVFDFEDVVPDVEENNLINGDVDLQKSSQDLLTDVVQATETKEPPELCDVPINQTETAETDSPAQSESSTKLEDLICQVARNDSKEHDEERKAAKVASQKKAASEEAEACEDSEASDDEEEEEYPESCSCEFCVPSDEQVPAKPLLPQIKSKDAGKICVVIDLDETLVHSSFKVEHLLLFHVLITA
ncbi:uncharacterized protein ctdsp1 isoform X1 [Astyanax mexicanus]|uniref:uncharacterized protein ctdsp1 isoform X1 n=1 Tax=Astyanax mexicanus TaxID=7994 RepID=UPI0020CADD74|nr:uncharacterized protein ctdsp1 isoform X1 [Astyanax mexicanus]